MNTKRLFLYLPLLLALMLVSVGCSKDDEREDDLDSVKWENGPGFCYTVEITNIESTPYDYQMLYAHIIDMPTDIDSQYNFSAFTLSFSNRNLRNQEQKIGNVLNIRILKYSFVTNGWGDVGIVCKVNEL